MPPTGSSPAELGSGARRLVRFRIWLAEHIRIGELQTTLCWAAIIGLAGAWTSIGFRIATEWLHAVFTGHHGDGYVESFRAMDHWRRLAVPTLGGLLAGVTLLLGTLVQILGPTPPTTWKPWSSATETSPCRPVW